MQTGRSELEVLARAQKRSVELEPSVQALYVVETVGARLAAAALGLRDTRTVVSWANGGPIKGPDQAHRLQALFRIVFAVAERFSAAVAAAFLRGSNPELDGRAPLTVLATERPEIAEERAVAAVEALFAR